MSDTTIIKDFAEKYQRDWVNIFGAIAHTERTRLAIQSALPAVEFNSDVDMVAFGSIARNECTQGSDVDWTLLIDGQVGPHYNIADAIKGFLGEAKMQEPGNSGMFGNITFGHDLVHYIGGEEDTNHNISRRILLLLEAEKLILNGETDQSGTAFDRVIKMIIHEYVNHDSSLVCNPDKTSKVPRFLLNDIIRFWRTVCVDFAYKQKGQPDGKWGLRNIKLRLSRKLIYIKGLMMCFSCYLNAEPGTDNVASHLHELIPLSPLEILIKVMSGRNVDELLLTIIDKYDLFLKMMNDTTIRDQLATLNPITAYQDPDFMEARMVANQFQETLYKLFDQDEELKEFTQKYVVF